MRQTCLPPHFLCQHMGIDQPTRYPHLAHSGLAALSLSSTSAWDPECVPCSLTIDGGTTSTTRALRSNPKIRRRKHHCGWSLFQTEKEAGKPFSIHRRLAKMQHKGTSRRLFHCCDNVSSAIQSGSQFQHEFGMIQSVLPPH